jgi:predicted HTH domain antitoxin
MFVAEDFVKANLYEDKEAVIQDALRHLLRGKPNLRIQMAIFRYQQEELSLAKAAEIAGVSWAQMRDILLEQGIDPALGPENLADAEAEVTALREYLATQQ